MGHIIASLKQISKGSIMIVVTGATGELGKLVVEALLKRVPAG